MVSNYLGNGINIRYAMKDDKKNKVSLNEQLRKIQHHTYYKINEIGRASCRERV